MLRLNLLLIILLSCSFEINGKPKAIINLIYANSISGETIVLAKCELRQYYNCKIQLLNDMNIPVEFNRDTINVIVLIEYLKKNISKQNGEKYLFLTEKGIAFSDNAGYSARGYAEIGGEFGVVSTLVIKHETVSKSEFRTMYGKILIHEMAHLFGLDHCTANDHCVLVSSLPNKEKFYSANKWLCKSCQDKIDSDLIRKKHKN